MLYKKIENKISSIPVTIKVTLWYTFFIAFLLFIIMSSALFVSNKLMKDLSEKELIKSVNEIVSDRDDFESFDDGIFFSIYKNDKKVEGAIPKGFNENLKFSNSTLSTYKRNNEKYFYYDVKLEKNAFVRGIIPINKTESGMKELSTIIIIFMPILFIIIIVGGYRIIKKAFKPVGIISNTALEIGKREDFSKRIEIDDGKDEIHKMADAFNNMLDNLENSYNRERQFNSDVSHELKTPVSVILAESEYALTYSENVEEAKDSLEVIYRQSKKMSALIKEIMELSKLERKEAIEKENINLSKILDLIIEDYNILFNDKKIKVNLNIESNLHMFGDKVMIERVIDNLLSNAMKFTKDNIWINLFKKDSKVILEIIDNGIGIEESKKNLIWNRFYQVNDSRNKENNSGYGLGLSFVYKIVSLHNGNIILFSEKDRGSKFIIEFNSI